jgi:threonine aldolase
MPNTDGIIDFRSDTNSSPQLAMNEFALKARVGNSHEREDSSENALLEYAAELLGKPAALFLPSGTMCNLIAFRVHCKAGEEIILDELYHPLHFEGGGYATVANLTVKTVRGTRGIFTASQVEQALAPREHYFPQSRLVCLEQTCNLGGGKIWPLANIAAINAVKNIT